jgi:hypothetical protein
MEKSGNQGILIRVIPVIDQVIAMSTLIFRPSFAMIGLMTLGFVSLAPQAAAQVHRGGVSHVQSHKASAFETHDLAQLTDEMRSHNARLRLLLVERDRELKTVKSKLNQALEQREMDDTSGIYPLFIATP